MNERIEETPLRRGQLLADLKNSPGWYLLEEILDDIDAAVVNQWRLTDPIDTAKVLALHAKANAVKEVHLTLLTRVNEEIETALQILQNSKQF